MKSVLWLHTQPGGNHRCHLLSLGLVHLVLFHVSVKWEETNLLCHYCLHMEAIRLPWLVSSSHELVGFQECDLSLQVVCELASHVMAGVFRSLRGAWGWYQVKLALKPVRTQMVTSGILWATGDAAAQSISRSLERRRAFKESTVFPVDGRQKVEEGTDWRRVAIASSFGVGFVGPVGHFWYEGLERFVSHGLKLKANTIRFIFTKVACDTFVFGPVHLLVFFTYLGLMSGRPWAKVKRDVERDFIPTYMTEGSGWAVIQVVNFRLIPVRHQLLFVNVFCLVDSAFLSWVKHQDDAPWKQYLTSLVTSSKPSASASS